MSQLETVYSAKQVADRLGISSGMLRRYAMAFEEITSQPVKQHPRDGRQYTSDQLATLERAKKFVTNNKGMSVEQALRLAMGASEADIVNQPSLSSQMSTEGLIEAYRSAQEPLLEEMQALRQSNERLVMALENRANIDAVVASRREQQALPEAGNANHSNQDDGLLVRLSRRLERLLGRRQ